MNHSKHLIITLSSALSVLVAASAVLTVERKTYEVEDFTDKNSSSVKTWAADNGVPSDMVLYTYGYSDEVGKGKIISQSVKPGEKLSSPDYITVRISDGKSPASKTLIPDFTGKKLDEIRKWFDDNGFDNVSYGTQARDDLDEGSFIIITPKSGSSVTKNDEITVITSVKPKAASDATATDDNNADEDSANNKSREPASVTPVPDQAVSPSDVSETPAPSDNTQKNSTDVKPSEEPQETPAAPSQDSENTDTDAKPQSDSSKGHEKEQSESTTDKSEDHASKTDEKSSDASEFQSSSADVAEHNSKS